ncbi:MAG: hypothetical protein JWN44_4262 [Myxococcales bacterium]|nr:hypothetical protein [Myxococcales bacterium]
MILRCDGPACRLRAGDLGLGAVDGESVECLGRCETPVAAEQLGRSLTIRRRGALEPYGPAELPRQASPPILLRDAGFADQPSLPAARRRGAWRAAPELTGLAARELLASLPTRPRRALANAFAGRALCERDPHLVLEGAGVVARADGTPHLAVRVPASWIDARAALQRAAAEAHADGLTGELSLVADGGVEPVRAARLARAAQLGVDWYERHLTVLCAVSGDIFNPGVYELPAGASVADAVAAAGGAVDGLCTAAAARFACDGEPATDPAGAAPSALVVFHARREPLAI